MIRIEGLAMVSRDGMLAASDGLMPNSLKFEEDQAFFASQLDAAALLVNGRMSHEGQPNSPNRRRFLFTRSTGAFSPTPVAPNVWAWNPAHTSFDDALAALGIVDGIVAILGGTALFDMFLPRYHAFHLVQTQKVELPGGVPVFSGGLTPQARLTASGLRLAGEALMSAEHALTYEKWTRGAAFA